VIVHRPYAPPSARMAHGVFGNVFRSGYVSAPRWPAAPLEGPSKEHRGSPLGGRPSTAIHRSPGRRTNDFMRGRYGIIIGYPQGEENMARHTGSPGNPEPPTGKTVTSEI